MDNMKQVYIERDVAEFLNLSMYQNQITFFEQFDALF